MRVGQRDDLAAVRRIGEDLLIAGHRRIEHHLTRLLPFAPTETPRNTARSSRASTAGVEYSGSSLCAATLAADAQSGRRSFMNVLPLGRSIRDQFPGANINDARGDCPSLSGPDTSRMPYRPAGCPADQPAAGKAPRAKVIRSVARWLISSRSPAAARLRYARPRCRPPAAPKNRCCPGADGVAAALGRRRSRCRRCRASSTMLPPAAKPYRRAHRASSGGVPRRSPRRRWTPNSEVASATSLESTATPILVFGAINTGMISAARSSSARASASNPVVPTRMGTRCCAQVRACRATASPQAEFHGNTPGP